MNDFAIVFNFHFSSVNRPKLLRMPSINGKMDSEEEDMDQDTPDSDKSDSRSSHSGSGSDEEESSGMKQLNMGYVRSVLKTGPAGPQKPGPIDL